jgi:hypothetical protein
VLVLMLVTLDGARCEWQRGSNPHRGDHLLLLLAVNRPAF